MADKCVALKCEVKDIFDKAHTKAVLKQMGETIEKLINKKKGKGLYFDNKCKDGWLLTAKVVSLTVDDPAKPKSMEIKATIDGVPLHSTGNGFKSSANSKATGINAKKLDKEATSLVDGIMEYLITKKAMPVMGAK